jgi:ABC-type Zn uptake system ZnuABC Zn-binding protein ZnuA
MTTKILVGGAVLIVIVLLTVTALPLLQNEVPPSGTSVTVGATIFPLADITQAIVGGRANVILIIPPGQSEHSSAVSPQQIQQLQAAAAIFQIGHGLDDRLMKRIEPVVAGAHIVTVDQGITLHPFAEHHHEEEGEEAEHRDEEESTLDPHYWLTVPNAQQIARTIAVTMQTIDPAGSELYARNLAAYLNELDTLEAELQAMAGAAQHHEFMATHNAWSYLGEHYGFQLVGTYEPVEGQEPAVADLKELQDIVSRYQLTTFYAEPQKVSSNITRFVQDELGLHVRILDPVGGSPERDSYPALMRWNISNLSVAL